jgi:hypothetical protein
MNSFPRPVNAALKRIHNLGNLFSFGMGMLTFPKTNLLKNLDLSTPVDLLKIYPCIPDIPG